jgi:hypothetical protein
MPFGLWSNQVAPISAYSPVKTQVRKSQVAPIHPPEPEPEHEHEPSTYDPTPNDPTIKRWTAQTGYPTTTGGGRRLAAKKKPAAAKKKPVAAKKPAAARPKKAAAPKKKAAAKRR